MIPLLARAFLLVGAWAAQEAAGAPPAQAPAAEKPSREERRIGSLFGGALANVRDHEEFTETPAYREMLDQVGRYGPDELRQKSEGELDVARALGNPSEWRGRILHVRSLVIRLETVRLAQPLGERVDVYRAYLSETDGSEGVIVDFLQEPPDLSVRDDLVDVEAVFFRVVRYENAKGDFVNAPQLIARGLRKYDQQEAPRKTFLTEPLAQITLGAGLVYLAVRVFTALRGKKSDSAGTSKTSRAIRDRANLPRRPKPHP